MHSDPCFGPNGKKVAKLPNASMTMVIIELMCAGYRVISRKRFQNGTMGVDCAIGGADIRLTFG